ncbi:MAG: hypothetical protein HOH02_07690 [Oceanospirillaceae bacterium]|nr:hypothetical protein [Oceanospirillaceae bacterium]MBT4443735.1 hypothetical protein [Oceanospirillaceae bacterium]MBT6077826.1 hypothetical protein [Oceanospirillaceae bacterium]
MSLALDSLDRFKTALDDGNTAPLAEMLAESFIFEDSVGVFPNQREMKIIKFDW